MKKLLPKSMAVHDRYRALGMVGLLLAVGIAFGWEPFREQRQIRVLAAAGPEAEILTFVRDRHPELGLDVRVDGQDYVTALTSGDVDVASAGTHVALLEQVRKTGAALSNGGSTVTKPLGFYASRDAGAQWRAATSVVLPAERQLQSRALLLLYSSGYVTFSRDANTDLTLEEVRGNPKSLTFTTATRDDRITQVSSHHPVLVALDYDEATSAELQPARDASLMEDGFSPFFNVLVVRESDTKAPWLAALVAAYRESEVKAFILHSYNDSVRRPW